MLDADLVMIGSQQASDMTKLLQTDINPICSHYSLYSLCINDNFIHNRASGQYVLLWRILQV